MARVAASLLHLRDQINALVPSRNKAWDGTIGDAAHAARKSDHNPDSNGIVCALDITNDPGHGVISEQIAETIRLSKDPRVQYVISNKRIANMDVAGGAWRPYTGTNPHDHHCHISVRHDPKLADDKRDWKLPSFGPGDAQVVPSLSVPLVRPGDAESASVNELKELLRREITKEAGYGAMSEACVRAFQRKQGFTVDGVVGPQTWLGLRKGDLK